MNERALVRGLSISKQPPAIIQKVQLEVRLTAQPVFRCDYNYLVQARDKFSVLAQYEGSWPARDMIATFLSNATYPKAATQGHNTPT